MAAPRVWLITGAGSGIGKATATRALEKGDVVVATDIKLDGLAELQSKYPPEKLLVHKLDVTVSDDIGNAFGAAKKAFGRLDIVYSNAGYGVGAELENVPIEIAKSLFDVNFWGMSQVGIAAVKFFRDENPAGAGGRLLMTSSMLGQMVFPFAGYYCASKHAIEAFGQSLQTELDPEWNIKITIIEPGMFRTGAVGSMIILPAGPAYDKPTNPTAALRQLVADKNVGKDVNKLSKQIIRVTELDNPPIRLALGKDSVAAIEQNLTTNLALLKEYASWSDDLDFDAE